MAVTQAQLDHFHQFASKQLGNGGADLTMDELLAHWRDACERDEVNAAIREGLADIDAGRVRPAEEVMRELREKYSLPHE